MQRESTVLLLMLSLLVLPFFPRAKASAQNNSEVIRVPSVDFPTIQSAIDNASSGATILLANGTYFESLVISKSLSLIGENRDTTIIDGGQNVTVVLIDANNVAIADLTVMKSELQTYSEGIHAQGAVGIIINNTKITNTYTGLILDFCSDGFLIDNVVTNNSNGIVLLYSSNNLISNNLLLNNENYGFNIIGSNNNVFFANTISGNRYVGFSISSSSTLNSFHHNNFQDSYQVLEGAANNWTSGGEGNYWIGYNFTEADLDNDGIGDRPYPIDEEANQDSHPLMGMFSDFRVNFQEKMHHVSFISNSSISNIRFEVGRETGNKIISFVTDSQDGSIGFCRMTVETSLMSYPFFVLDSDGEVDMNILSTSNATSASLYFTFEDGNQMIAIISSTSAQLFAELFDSYSKLQENFNLMNITYSALLVNLNASVQTAINNFKQLQSDYSALNKTLNETLADQFGNTQNIHNLSYVLIAITGAFLVTTVYLSNRLYANNKQRTRPPEEE